METGRTAQQQKYNYYYRHYYSHYKVAVIPPVDHGDSVKHTRQDLELPEALGAGMTPLIAVQFYCCV